MLVDVSVDGAFAVLSSPHLPPPPLALLCLVLLLSPCLLTQKPAAQWLICPSRKRVVLQAGDVVVSRGALWMVMLLQLPLQQEPSPLRLQLRPEPPPLQLPLRQQEPPPVPLQLRQEPVPFQLPSWPQEPRPLPLRLQSAPPPLQLRQQQEPSPP